MNIKLDENGEGVKNMKKNSKKKEEVILPAIYYCIKGLYSFMIDEVERDSDGKIIINSEGKQQVRYGFDANGNNRHVITKNFIFERFPVKNKETGKTDPMVRVGRFIVEVDNDRRNDIIAAIERGRANKLNGIMTEDEYKHYSNDEAYHQEKEKKKLQDENANLSDENEMLRKKLADAGIEF